MTKTKNKKVPVFGVIVSGVTRQDAIDRYLDAVNGNSVSLYTSNSSNLGILSEAGTHLYNPLTANADMEESDEAVETMLSSFSSNGDSIDAHYMLCSDGCGAHVVASDNFISQYCPVCASELSEPDEEENADDSDLEDFDDSFEEENDSYQGAASVIGDEDEDDVSESSEITDEEIDHYSAIAGIDISESGDDEDEDDVSESSEITDEEIDHYSAIAGISFSDDDEECDEECEESDDEDYEESEEEPESEEESEDDSDFEESEEEPESEDTDAAQSDIVAVAPTKEDAVTAFAEACISGSVTKHVSSLSGHTFYSASSDHINFDPILGDPNLESSDVVISVSSFDELETVDAHYMVCSSAECGSHIVTSNGELAFCPVCASDVEEPDCEGGEEECDSEPDSDEDDAGFSLEVIDEDNEGEGSESSNEKALSQVLSFVAAGNEVSTSKLNVSYCGNVNGENSWIAFYNGQPIARSTSSTAEKHKTIFEEPAYANAVLAGAEHLGISKILDEMGFMASMSSVAISKELEKNILNRHFKEKMSAMSAQLENELATKTSDYKERFIAALSTAAVGINRGFFKGYTNPVKQTLLNSLSAAGVRQPEVMLDNVFRSHSDDYNKMLVEKALEILDKPVEVQNEIAIAVSESNYMGASNSSAETNVESRLTTLGKEVAQPVSVSSNVTQFDQNRMKTVIANLGKRY